MTLEVEIGGRVRSITIEPLGAVGPTGGRFRVATHAPATQTSNVELRASNAESAGPVAQVIDVRRTDLGFSLLFADGRSLDLAVTDRTGGEHFVQLPHVGVTAVVEGRRARRGSGGDVTGTGEQRLLAPMPGRIVRVLVKPGDEVAPRQGLIVVEAMKMENELTAARAGRVREVAVAEGQSVQAGQLLVIVE